MEKLARRICERAMELSVSDWNELVTPDARYENMPLPDSTAVGPEQIHRILRPFAQGFDLSSDIRNVIRQGDTVVVERVESVSLKTDPGVRCEFPCVGIFRFRNGKVSEWRDYFDATVLTELMTSVGHPSSDEGD